MGLASFSVVNDPASKTYVDSRTPLISKATTAPTDTTAVWIDTN